ncbi:hypothetical protein JRO89_XS11G0224300 [Xanthoceras sorbifolium]|uniref:CCT domain-containing protein n=1 Tax=Xanthoceras sorbifolium TaxID=99658 RepID=A0ABQ8HGQ2_9ROSI|nr:hypothetical protein JRO89_XS11G0224300 [Xanthoceras sorbifolium]
MDSSSIPHFYCDYNNSLFASTDFYQFSSYMNSGGETTWGGGGGDHHAAALSSGAISSGDAISIATTTSNNSGAIWGTTSSSSTTLTADQEISFPLSNFDSSILQPESPPAVMPSFPEQLGMLASVGPTFADYGVALFGVSGMQNDGGVCCDEFGDHHRHDHEYCYGFVQDFKPVYPSTAAENWGIQKPSMEDINTKVGRYSVEERKDRILRYLKKKNQRNFNKTIKYECRKTLADRRVRVRGRFARNSEQLCEEDQMVMKNNNGNNNIHQKDNKELYCTTDAFQMKQDEEWLQEAMASLMYLPYITG